MDYEQILNEISELKAQISGLNSQIFTKHQALELIEQMKRQVTKDITSRLGLIDSKLTNYEAKLYSQSAEIVSLRDGFKKAEKGNVKTDEMARNIYQEISYMTNQMSGIKEEIQLKCNHYDLKQIEEKLEIYTPLIQFDLLQEQVEGLAPKSKVEEVESQVEELRVKSEEFIKGADLEQLQTDMFEDISEILKEYIDIKQFKEESKKIYGAIEEFVTETRKNRGLLEKQITAVRRDTQGIIKVLKGKPWLKEIQELHEICEQKVSNELFIEFRQRISNNIKETNDFIENTKNNVQQFSEILERFDEILIDKAGKLDIAHLKKDCEQFVTLSILRDELIPLQTSIQSIQQRISEVKQKRVKLPIASYNIPQNESKSRESIEQAIIQEYFQETKQLLDTKTDKSDFLLTLANLAQKAEVRSIEASISKLRSQLENSITIIKTVLKTLITPNDSLSSRNRQRKDLYKNTASLLSWVTSGDIAKMKPRENLSAKRFRYASQPQSPKGYIDISIPLRPSKRISCDLDFEFPPLNSEVSIRKT